MPAIARELKITYGSRVVGGSTSYLIHDVHRLEIGYEQAAIELEVIVAEDTEAAFKTACANLETDFRKPNLLFKIEQGAQTLLDLDPSAGTGFNTRSVIRKPGSEADSGRSRLYRILITALLPADESGKNARRNSSIRLLTASTGAKTVIISGVYTASSANTSARDQYDAQIGTYTTAAITAVGGTAANWETVTDESEEDEEDNILIFRRILRLPIYNQTSGTLNHAAIKNDRVAVSLADTQPMAAHIDARRLMQINVRYQADIDSSASTSLKSLWDDTIEPYLISYAQTQSGAGAMALIKSDPQLDPMGNTVAGTLTLLGFVGSGLLSSSRARTLTEESGRLFAPVWDGNPLAKHVWQGPGEKLLTVVETRREFGGSVGASSAGSSGGVSGGSLDMIGSQIDFTSGGQPFGDITPGGGFGFGDDSTLGQLNIFYEGGGGGSGGGPASLTESLTGGEGWVRTGTVITQEPIIVGLPSSGHQIQMTRTTRVERWRWAETPAQATGSGGGSGGDGRVTTPGGGRETGA